MMLTGIILLIDGLNYVVQGSQYIQYAYFALAFAQVFILPFALERRFLNLSSNILTVGYLTGEQQFMSRDVIESIEFNNEKLKLRFKGKSLRIFWLTPKADFEWERLEVNLASFCDKFDIPLNKG